MLLKIIAGILRSIFAFFNNLNLSLVSSKIEYLGMEFKMIYGYIRVSTDKQTVENQRYEINLFCEKHTLCVNKWIEETISGSKNVQDRKLGMLLNKMKKGDILICSELSRLGRNLLMIMGVLNECMNRDIQVWTIKDNYRLGSDINSKVLAFAFGLSAEIERNLISQRTKEALARKRAEGVILGRPRGSKSSKTKLTGQEKKILELLERKVSYSAIGRILGVHRLTVSSFIKKHRLQS
ncbi:master DNA invertase Mpi family serine-type recombinase [Pelistega sp. MC2]|uniref:master DNA invertase Mpi family serine-type recombinase n=1 Tax=Pelistega sp. MC2 TaxID=1720297 RepID=UPI000A935B66|nr:master DNA invertase Mpi family serine-type recombinase [Pelistega sp. MC2]